MRGLMKAVQTIRAADTVLLGCHMNPDGDAIGSMVALGLGLKQLDKKVSMICADPVPKMYATLPGIDRVVRYVPVKKRFDLAVAVDCSYRHMLGEAQRAFEQAAAVMAFDHHLERDAFGPIDVIDKDAAAMAEVVYPILKKLRVKITRAIAENLLTSIIVETNSFRLSAVRGRTFRISAELTRTGIDYSRLSERVYWAVKKEAALLMGVCLQRSQFMKGGQLVWAYVRKRDFQKFGGRDEDVDAVPDELRAIQGVKVVVFFRETKDGCLRISLRSKKGINVAALARQYGGGGHYDVAGCLLANTPRDRKQFLNKVAQLI